MDAEMNKGRKRKEGKVGHVSMAKKRDKQQWEDWGAVGTVTCSPSAGKLQCRVKQDVHVSFSESWSVEKLPRGESAFQLLPQQIPLLLSALHEASVLLRSPRQVGHYLVHRSVGNVLVDGEACLAWRTHGGETNYKKKKRRTTWRKKMECFLSFPSRNICIGQTCRNTHHHWPHFWLLPFKTLQR